MKMKYDREEDILMVETASGKIDHAEEMGPVIVHFTKAGKPVLLEILDGSEFLSLATKTSIKAQPLELHD
ncbi:MAG: DUF2283 domain-containing protein [Deltaproteobacteria bacterium]|nr:DUF2283 domain-containing protein [Deltaproteobacteria bacterium]